MATVREYRRVVTRYQADASGLIAELRAIDRSVGRASRSLQDLNRNFSALSRLTRLGFQAYWIVTYVEQVGRLAYAFAEVADNLVVLRQRFKFLSQGNTAAFGQVIDFADRLGISFDEATQTIQTFAPAFSKMGKSFTETLTFTEDLTKSFRVFGVTTEAAARAIYQLAQGFSAGRLQGDELRSLQENAGGLALELEKAVIQITGITAPLRELGAEGVLSADVLEKGFSKVFSNLRKDIDELPNIISYSAQRAANAWSVAMGTLSENSGFNKWLASVFEDLSNLGEMVTASGSNFKELTIQGLITEITEAEEALKEVTARADKFLKLQEKTGKEVTAYAFTMTKVAEATERLGKARDALAARNVSRDTPVSEIEKAAKAQAELNKKYDQQADLLKQKKKLILELASTDKALDELSKLTVATDEQKQSLAALNLMRQRAIEYLAQVDTELSKVNKSLENEFKLTENVRFEQDLLNAIIEGFIAKQKRAQEVTDTFNKALARQREEVDRINKAYEAVQAELDPAAGIRAKFDAQEDALFDASQYEPDHAKLMKMFDELRKKRDEALPGGKELSAAKKFAEIPKSMLKGLEELAPAFAKAGEKWKLPPELLISIARYESGFNKVAKSAAGAFGVMQIMPGTMTEISRATGIAVSDMMTDASANIDAGAYYIKQQILRFGGDVEKGLAAYNWGPAKKNKALHEEGPLDRTRIPKETQDYLTRILPLYASLLAAQGDLSASTDLYKSSTDAAAAAEERRVANAISLEQAQANLAERFKEVNDDFDSLMASLDPLTAAQQEYAKSVDLVTLALQLEQATIAEVAVAMDLIMKRYQQAAKEAAATKDGLVQLSIDVQNTLESSISSWVDSAVEGTFKVRDAIKGLVAELAKLAIKWALMSGLNAAFPSLKLNLKAKGDSFAGIDLPQGVYTKPTFFKFATGGRLGVLGEAGPEAIMPMRHGGIRAKLPSGKESSLPLTRMASGHLGVRVTPFAKGGSVTNIVSFAKKRHSVPAVHFAKGGIPITRFAAGGEVSPQLVAPRTPIVQVSPPNITVINNASGIVETETRTTPQGDIEFVISRIVNDISRGGNSTSRAFENAYALNRAR